MFRGSLGSFSLIGCPKLQDISDIKSCMSLRSVELISLPAAKDLSELFGMNKLRRFIIKSVGKDFDIKDFDWLRSFTNIEEFSMTNPVQNVDWFVFSNLKNLKKFQFFYYANDVDPSKVMPEIIAAAGRTLVRQVARHRPGKVCGYFAEIK